MSSAAPALISLPGERADPAAAEASWGDVDIHDTLPKMLRFNAERHGNEVAMRKKDLGIWNEYTWEDFERRVRRLALFFADCGLQPGDVVGLLGQNGPYWPVGALAALAGRGLSLGVYSDVLGDEAEYQVGHTEARFMVVEDEEQVDKLLELDSSIPSVAHIVYDDPRGMRKYNDPRLISMDAALEAGRIADEKEPERYGRMVDATSAEEPALLISTSGTTTRPKFAEIANGAFLRHVREYLRREPKTAGDEYISALPLPWIMETKYVLGKGLVARMKVNYPEDEDTIMADLREIGPTFLLLAPRVWEQLAGEIRARVLESTPLKQRIYSLGIRIGLQALDKGRQSKLADMLVFSALRDTLGFSRLRAAATGGAALGPDTYRFFVAMGIPLRQVYGQTELVGAYTVHEPDAVSFETSGTPFAGVEVRIVDPDPEGLGKIETRHPNMMKGYYRNPEATREAVVDGWMQTGDAGHIDGNGHLIVIDRYKDLARTAGGFNFSPQYLENKLKFSPYIAEAVVSGNEREFLAAIVCIRFPIVSKWAEQRRIAFTSYTDLSGRSEVRELVRREIASINDSLLPAMRIRRFLLLYKPLDADDGELTRTRKVRRGVINERYAQLIDALHGTDRQEVPIDSEITLQDGGKQRIKTTVRIAGLGGDDGEAAREGRQ